MRLRVDYGAMSRALALSLLAALAYLPPAPGADEDDGGPGWYKVEIVVFAQGPEVAMTSPPEMTGEPAPQRGIDLLRERLPPAPDEPRPPVRPPPPDPDAEARAVLERWLGIRDLTAPPPARQRRTPEPFVPLAFEALTLSDAVQRLARAPGYRTLIHTAWHQPSFPFGQGQAALLHGTRAFDADAPIVRRIPRRMPAPPRRSQPIHEVEGAVTFSEGRYKHVAVDMVLRKPVAGFAGAQSLETTRLDTLDLGTLGLDYAIAGFRLQQERRIEPDTLHYFDHRHLGVLAQVTQLDLTPEHPIAPPLAAERLWASETSAPAGGGSGMSRHTEMRQ